MRRCVRSKRWAVLFFCGLLKRLGAVFVAGDAVSGAAALFSFLFRGNTRVVLSVYYTRTRWYVCLDDAFLIQNIKPRTQKYQAILRENQVSANKAKNRYGAHVVPHTTIPFFFKNSVALVRLTPV